jgi:hypothetical protein
MHPRWEGMAMNWIALPELDSIRRQSRGKWGKLTDDDWTVIAGKRDQLIDKLQERDGIAR